jgi:hypothetical protein
MTIANFKARIYGFINRSSTLFTTTEGASIDQVVYAMTDAVTAAQREYSFELLRTDAFLSTSEIGANWMTGCKTTPGGATAVLMKRIDSTWNFATQSISAGTLYARSSRIDLGSPGQFKRELSVDVGANGGIVSANTMQITRRKFAYANGANLCVVTLDTSTPILVNGIKFVDAITDNDIFLTYFTDWLFWATLIQLNQFLKDDQRINIDMAFVGRLWQSVKEMDGQIANAGDGADLN